MNINLAPGPPFDPFFCILLTVVWAWSHKRVHQILECKKDHKQWISTCSIRRIHFYAFWRSLEFFWRFNISFRKVLLSAWSVFRSDLGGFYKNERKSSSCGDVLSSGRTSLSRQRRSTAAGCSWWRLVYCTTMTFGPDVTK